MRSTPVMLASNSAPILTKKLSACDTVIDSEMERPTSPGLSEFRENTAKSEASVAIRVATWFYFRKKNINKTD